ncbi:MAG: hypothetical protein ACREA0_34815, partial [bacterium]
LNLWWPEVPGDRAALRADDPGPGAVVGMGVSIAEELFRRLAGAGWGAPEYRSRCVTLGRRITWSGVKSGLARDIDPEDGSLVVEIEGGGIARLNAGEVRHVR